MNTRDSSAGGSVNGRLGFAFSRRRLSPFFQAFIRAGAAAAKGFSHSTKKTAVATALGVGSSHLGLFSTMTTTSYENGRKYNPENNPERPKVKEFTDIVDVGSGVLGFGKKVVEKGFKKAVKETAEEKLKEKINEKLEEVLTDGMKSKSWEGGNQQDKNQPSSSNQRRTRKMGAVNSFKAIASGGVQGSHVVTTTRTSNKNFDYHFTFTSTFSTSTDAFIAGHASDIIVGGGMDIIVMKGLEGNNATFLIYIKLTYLYFYSMQF